MFRTDDIIDGIISAARWADIAVVGSVAHSRLHEFVFGDSATELSDRLDVLVPLVHPRERRNQSFVRGLVEGLAF